YAVKYGIPNNQDLVFNYLCSLNHQYCNKAWTLIANHHGDQIPDKLELVVQMVQSLAVSETSSDNNNSSDSNFDSEEETDSDDERPQNKCCWTKINKSKGKGKATMFPKRNACFLHPKSNHTHFDCEKLKEVLRMSHNNNNNNNNNWQNNNNNKFGSHSFFGPSNKNYNNGAGPSNVNLCRFCRYGLYVRGHECQEMLRARRSNINNNNNNNMVCSHMTHLSSQVEDMLSINDDKLIETSSNNNKGTIKTNSLLQYNTHTQNTNHSLKYNRTKKNTDLPLAIFVPITLQDKQLLAFLDTGCDKSSFSLEYLKNNKLSFTSFTHHSSVITSIEGKTVTHTFKALPLSENIIMTIGMDLMPKLGISIHGLATSWDDNPHAHMNNDTCYNVPPPNNSPAGSKEEQNNFHIKIKPFLKQNEDIPPTSHCPLPDALEEGVIIPAPVNTAWNQPLTATPISNIQEIFSKLMSGCNVFTTLDLKAAFERFPVLQEHQQKLSFMFLGKQYSYAKGCFGLKTLSSAFQRVMNILFYDLPFVNCFIDDIIVASKNIHEHADHVVQVIKILTDPNLILNLDKCNFAQASIHLLGFSVSAECIALDVRKVTTVLDYPPLQTGKDCMKFGGLINYFHSSIPNCAKIMAPIDALRHEKSLKGKWGTAQQKAFDTVRQILTKTPILHYPSLNDKFYIGTDASNSGIACTQPIANRMMINWLETILSYPSMKIVHILGSQNTLPDLLSRLYEDINDIVSLRGGNAPVPTQLRHSLPQSNNNNNNKNQNLNTNDTIHMHSLHADNPFIDMITSPVEDQYKLLLDQHNFGHFGAEAMTKGLRSQGFNWNGIFHQALSVVHACDTCAKNNIIKHRYHPLRPVQSYLPADHWALDLAGPFKTTLSGNNYLLVVIDLYFSFPRYINTDWGSEFVNSIMEKLIEAAGVYHHKCTPYHARSNPAERYVQTSVRALRKSIRGAIKSWDIFVPGIQLAINAKISKRTDTAPYTLIFARKINQFQDFRNEIGVEPLSYDELKKRIHKMETVVFPAINERVKAILDAQAQKFNKKHLIVDFPPNSHVMVRVTDKGSKLENEYEGPYLVIRKTRGGSYVLKDEMAI
ncbi:hypothetical protein INT45_012704, partial [Circinella minor]